MNEEDWCGLICVGVALDGCHYAFIYFLSNSVKISVLHKMCVPTRGSFSVQCNKSFYFNAFVTNNHPHISQHCP